MRDVRALDQFGVGVGKWGVVEGSRGLERLGGVSGGYVATRKMFQSEAEKGRHLRYDRRTGRAWKELCL